MEIKTFTLYRSNSLGSPSGTGRVLDGIVFHNGWRLDKDEYLQAFRQQLETPGQQGAGEDQSKRQSPPQADDTPVQAECHEIGAAEANNPITDSGDNQRHGGIAQPPQRMGEIGRAHV